MRFTTSQAWLDWQRKISIYKINLGLERVQTVAYRMGLSKPSFPLLTVAGTNGKGSSVALAERILRANGWRTGRFMSPHLQRYHERIAVNGIDISEQALCEVFAFVDQARGEVILTEFEFSTLAAIAYFQHCHVDIAVVEVGLGGRLDAINAFDPAVALLCAIDLDHQAWLGQDREQIGREKAGIFRREIPAVCADPLPPDSIAQVAASLNAPLYQAGRDFTFQECPPNWQWQYRNWNWRLPRPRLPGNHQFHNAAGVLTALACLPAPFQLTQATAEIGLQTVHLPGRMQALGNHRYVDVAHNPHAAAALAAMLAQSPMPTLAVVGMLNTKDIENTLRAMIPQVSAWYCATLDAENAVPGTQLAAVLQSLGITACHCGDSVYNAYLHACSEAKHNARVVVFGSFHTVAEVLQYQT